MANRSFRVRSKIYKAKNSKKFQISPKVQFKQRATKLKRSFLFRAEKLKQKELKHLPKVKKHINLIKPTKHKQLTILKTLPYWNKTKVTTYDKLFYYYTVKTPTSLYAHKAFILLEMQLNASLVRMKLIPYLFLVNELCFYRIIRLNGAVVSSPFHVLSLYDNVSIPVALYNYMYYRNYRVQHYPRQLANFFKRYWMQFTNYNQNKVWLLTNFLVSHVTAEAIIFDYPNIISYMSPFKRFTNLYYRNQQYADLSDPDSRVAYTHTIVKLKLFTYAAFYK